MTTYSHRPSLVPPGLLLGAGLGGFLDGIVLHQLLQWHNMLSAVVPILDLDSAKVNMFWDGVFHAGVWVLTLLGLGLLWRATGYVRHVGEGRILSGSMLAGWGLLNLIEGVTNHLVLGLHHVREHAPTIQERDAWDWGFAIVGVVMALAGLAIALSGNARRKQESRAGAPG